MSTPVPVAPTSIFVELTQEFLARVYVGLGELQSKYAHDVITSLETQAKTAVSDVKSYVANIEAKIAPLKAQVETKIQEVEAEASKLIAEAKVDLNADEVKVKTWWDKIVAHIRAI